MTNHECMSLFGVVLVSELPSSKQDSVEFIHVIFSLTQIERSAIFGRETGSQVGRFFHGKAYSILVSKIVICSNIDNCKMFYLPPIGQQEVNMKYVSLILACSGALYTAKCAGNYITFYIYFIRSENSINFLLCTMIYLSYVNLTIQLSQFDEYST